MAQRSSVTLPPLKGGVKCYATLLRVLRKMLRHRGLYMEFLSNVTLLRKMLRCYVTENVTPIM